MGSFNLTIVRKQPPNQLKMKATFAITALIGAASAWEGCKPTHYEDWVVPAERKTPSGADHVCWKHATNLNNMCHLFMKCHWDTFFTGANPHGDENNSASWCPGTCSMLNRWFPRQACKDHHRVPVLADRWTIDEDAKTACYEHVIPNTQGQRETRCVDITGEFTDVHPYGTPIEWDLYESLGML